MGLKEQVKVINEESHPNAGGRMAKPDNADDTLKSAHKVQTEFEAKDKPGAALKAGQVQRKDAKNCDETLRTPSNTPCCCNE